MSIQYCHNCGKYIDTDFNAEHFEICKPIKKYNPLGNYNPLKEVDELVDEAKKIVNKRKLKVKNRIIDEKKVEL